MVTVPSCRGAVGKSVFVKVSLDSELPSAFLSVSADRKTGGWMQLDMPAISCMPHLKNMLKPFKNLTCEAALEYVNRKTDVKSNERLFIASTLPPQLNVRRR